MKMFSRTLIGSYFCLLFFAIFDVQATPKPSGTQYQEVGHATFSVMFWDIYQGRLYSHSGQYHSNDYPLKFEITYLRDIKKKKLIEITKEQWQHLALDQKLMTDYLFQLEHIWPDIRKQDALSIEVLPSKSIFYFNNKRIGEVDDHAFGQHFIDIWLSERTKAPSFRKALLGLN